MKEFRFRLMLSLFSGTISIDAESLEEAQRKIKESRGYGKEDIILISVMPKKGE